jgi:hypothetical protein
LLELLAARCRAVVRQTREHFIIPEITGFGGDEGNLMMFSKQLQAWSAAFNSNYQLLYNMQTMGRQLSVQYQSILPENLSFWELIELRPLLTDVLLPTVSIGFDQMMLAVTNKDAAQQFVETIASMLEKLLQSGFSDSPAVSSKPVAGSGSGEWEIMQSLLRRIHQLADSYGLQDHLPSTII